VNQGIAKRVLLPIAIAIVVAEPLLFWNAFAGDAQVHLTFMENAAQGRFFEFNPGQQVSGETSPGYMLLGALLFRLLSTSAVPIALKIIGLLSWYLLCWLVWRGARGTLGTDEREVGPVWAAVAAFVAATLAGSVYNANAGMENGLFAAAVWGWILLAAKWRWFEGGATSIAREISLALWLGVCGWLRPEALIVTIVAYLVRGRAARWRAASLLGLPLALLIGALAFAFERAFTGDLLPISIASRRVLAMPHTAALGPLTFDPTFAVRLLVYLPLTALFAVARLAPADKPEAGIRRFLHLLFAVFFLLYSLGGTPHLARYLIFLMPILAIGAAEGAERLWRRRTAAARAMVVIAGLALATLGTIEPYRRHRLYPPNQLATAAAAPASRLTHTDQLLRALGGAPRDRPLVVALESVQLRYEVDDRIVVRSLDGRVDPPLFRHVGRGTVDHLGYLQAQRVDVLLDTPSYNRAPSDWSLAALRELQPGQVVAHGGVAFRRLAMKKAFALSLP